MLPLAAQAPLTARAGLRPARGRLLPGAAGANAWWCGAALRGHPFASSSIEHAGIERDGHGLMLESDRRLAAQPLRPGDDVEAAGRIGARGGLVVLQVSAVRVLGRWQPPRPCPSTIDELQGFRHLGRLVTVGGRVIEVGENTAGAYMLIGRARDPYKLFLPHAPATLGVAGFAGFAVGDTVRATGMASQYCPPAFQPLVPVDGGPARRRGAHGPSARLPPGPDRFQCCCSASVFGVIIWRRERHLRAQREALRRSHELGEEILGASSAADVLRKTTAVLPALFGVTGVALYAL